MLRKFYRPRSPLDCAALIRHVAICAAALTAYLLRDDLRVGNHVLSILAIAVLLNLGTTVLSDRRAFRRIAHLSSSLFGLGCWSALVLMTGGVGSPFIAGFGLEIILSALIFSPPGTALTTVGAMAGLWLQQSLRGIGSSLSTLSLQTVFLLAMGGVTLFVARGWALAQQDLARQAAGLNLRLQALEEELEDARRLGRVGEATARMAHGLKNALHSLRGCARLIESRVKGAGGSRQALEGLQTAIDRVEEIARVTLHPGRAGPEAHPCADGAAVSRAIAEAIEEVGRIHPAVRWVKPLADSCPPVALSPALLREVLLLLTQNAAEAVGDSGEIAVATSADQGILRIDIRDDGPGFPEGLRDKLFRPGWTTKPQGTGFGLFLARRLVESHGGSLTAETAGSGGALFSVRLPVRGD